MLGSAAEADDALQETWLRLDRRPPARVDDLRPWLTTVVGRICLDMLRARRVRREEQIVVVDSIDTTGSVDAPAGGSRALSDPAPLPDQEADLADTVGLALLASCSST